MTKMYPYPSDGQAPQVLNEAASAYLSKRGISSAKSTFLAFLNNKLLVVEAIHKGITQSFFEVIRSGMPFSDQEWADIFNISLKSLQRYKSEKDHIFKPIHSEKILQTAEVIEEGVRVFGSRSKFFQWFDAPNFALGSRTPRSLIGNAYGQEMVRAELNAIEHGVFAG